MIQQLIQLIINQLVAGLAGVITTPATRITQGPITRPSQALRPRITLEADKLEWRQSLNDDTSGQPRNIESRERIPVSVGLPQGPYLLGNQPLAGTLDLVVVYNEGLVTEYTVPLLAGIDFTMNIATSQFTVIKPIVGANALRAVYSFVGNASVREFEQTLLVTLFLDTWTDLNRLSGLTTAIIHSQQVLLLDQFNFLSPSNFSANGFFCQVQLQRLKLVSMTMPPRTSTQALSDVVVVLNFVAVGTERLGKSLSGGFGIVQSIHTQGSSGPGVTIKPTLG